MMTLDYVYSMSYSICVYSSSITTCKLSTEDFELMALPVLVSLKLYHNYPPSHKCNSSIILRVTQLTHSVGNVLLVIYPAILSTDQCAQLDEIAGLGVEEGKSLKQARADGVG